MNKLLVLIALLASPAWSQEEGKEKKDKKKGDAPREERKDKKEKPSEGACGKGRADVFEAMKKQGLGGDDLEGFVDGHFKDKHPEGPCHCTCGHEKEPGAAPKPAPREGEACGKTARQILESGPRIDENKVAEHFKGRHPKGEACHCSCGHEEKHNGKPREKGNNGLGNGEDPQPPGKPPVNDGPGSKPGKPGNRGGDKR